MLQEVLGERVKAFLAWQNAMTSLQKKREQRSRLELGGKLDRMGAVLEVQTLYVCTVIHLLKNANF